MKRCKQDGHTIHKYKQKLKKFFWMTCLTNICRSRKCTLIVISNSCKAKLKEIKESLTTRCSRLVPNYTDKVHKPKEERWSPNKERVRTKLNYKSLCFSLCKSTQPDAFITPRSTIILHMLFCILYRVPYARCS